MTLKEQVFLALKFEFYGKIAQNRPDRALIVQRDEPAGIKETRLAFLRYCHASNYAMANRKESQEKHRGERATATRRGWKIDEKGGWVWKGCVGCRCLALPRRCLAEPSSSRRCAICSQQEKPELIKAHNYLRFEPFVLTGVSCPI